MIHAASCRLTDYFLEHNWIEAGHYDWCVYVVEKKLLQGCFLFILVLGALVSKRFVGAVAFMAAFYLLRSRVGGWHAPYSWLCLSLTTAMVLAVLFWLGPLLLAAEPSLAWGLDVLVMAAAFWLKPIYPPQLHFEREVVQANIAKKNGILAVILLLQLAFFIIEMRQVLVFSFYGVLISVLLVLAEWIQQKVYGGSSHELSGKSR